MTGELLTVPEAMRRLRLSRGTIYALMRRGDLQSVAIGGARRILADSVEGFVARLLAEQTGYAPVETGFTAAMPAGRRVSVRAS